MKDSGLYTKLDTNIHQTISHTVSQFKYFSPRNKLKPKSRAKLNLFISRQNNVTH